MRSHLHGLITKCIQDLFVHRLVEHGTGEAFRISAALDVLDLPAMGFLHGIRKRVRCLTIHEQTRLGGDCFQRTPPGQGDHRATTCLCLDGDNSEVLLLGEDERPGLSVEHS